MGGIRQSDNLHQLNGTYRKDRHGDPDRKIEFEEQSHYPAPDFLPAAAKVEWFRMTNLFRGTGVFTEPDLKLLAGYCTLVAQLEADPMGFSQNGHMQLTRYANILGLGHLNRQKLQSPFEAGKANTGSKQNPFDATKKTAVTD
jgi:phage terminase small subunit